MRWRSRSSAPGRTLTRCSLLPREALKALRMVAREGICGLEVVEIAPEYDHSDVTAQLGARAIMDVLGTLVEEHHLGTRPTRQEREAGQA